MAQYDEYGSLYTHLKNRPIPIMQNRYASEAMGDLTGLRVLDGACGTGFYSQMMARKGASEVIGIDISPGMIDHAKRELPSRLRDNTIQYFVGDFERENLLPNLGLEDMRGTFDVVFAAWLLNYAADWQHMSRMLANIFDAMKPGGRLICLTPNPFLLTQHGPEMADREHQIGDSWQVTEAYDFGFKVHMIVNAYPLVEFDSYVLYESEYNKAAAAVGLSSLSWKIGVELKKQPFLIRWNAGPVYINMSQMIPTEVEFAKNNRDWWKPYINRPRGCVLSATKPLSP